MVNEIVDLSYCQLPYSEAADQFHSGHKAKRVLAISGEHAEYYGVLCVSPTDRLMKLLAIALQVSNHLIQIRQLEKFYLLLVERVICIPKVVLYLKIGRTDFTKFPFNMQCIFIYCRFLPLRE
jgi:hypothetical protein